MGGIQPNIIPDKGADLVVSCATPPGPAAKENLRQARQDRRGRGADDRHDHGLEFVASAWPQLGNKAMAEAIQKNIDAVGMPKWSDEDVKFAREFQTSLGLKPVGLNTQPVKFGAAQQSFASNDSGDVTWNVPTGTLDFAAGIPACRRTTGRPRSAKPARSHTRAAWRARKSGGQHA